MQFAFTEEQQLFADSVRRFALAHLEKDVFNFQVFGEKGGADWEKWDKSMTSNVDNVQNADGSWSGHHCITGRTFCTAAALTVLTIDRSPEQAVAKVDLKK